MLASTGIGDVSARGQAGTAAFQEAIANLQQQNLQRQEEGVAKAIMDATKAKKPGEYHGMEDALRIAGMFPKKNFSEISKALDEHNNLLKYNRMSSLTGGLLEFLKEPKNEKHGLTPRSMRRYIEIAGIDMEYELPEFLERIQNMQQAGVLGSLKKDDFTLGEGQKRFGYGETGEPEEIAGVAKTGAASETPEQRISREKEIARFKYDLEKKYKDTPEGRLAKQKELEEHKAGLKPETKSDIQRQTEWLASLTSEERAEALKNIGDLAAAKSSPSDKPAQSYLLPNKEMVLSYDGGRTYTGKDGKSKRMPSNAVKVGATITSEDLAMFKAQERAAKGLPSQPKQKSMEEAVSAAEGGTGPWATASAAFNALAGGLLGIDTVFGKKGFFKDTQENRQVLRSIKQIGKSALMNSSRGAIWEQQRIDELFPDPDKVFTNPRTEALKFRNLHGVLSQEKEFNNRSIVSAVSPKEVSRLVQSNEEIDRLLNMIGKPGETTSEEDALINKYLNR
jgi:hypothetical protein